MPFVIKPPAIPKKIPTCVSAGFNFWVITTQMLPDGTTPDALYGTIDPDWSGTKAYKSFIMNSIRDAFGDSMKNMARMVNGGFRSTYYTTKEGKHLALVDLSLVSGKKKSSLLEETVSEGRERLSAMKKFTVKLRYQVDVPDAAMAQEIYNKVKSKAFQDSLILHYRRNFQGDGGGYPGYARVIGKAIEKKTGGGGSKPSILSLVGVKATDPKKAYHEPPDPPTNAEAVAKGAKMADKVASLAKDAQELTDKAVISKKMKELAPIAEVLFHPGCSTTTSTTTDQLRKFSQLVHQHHLLRILGQYYAEIS